MESIRGAGAMTYFVAATVPDLIIRILFALDVQQKLWKHWNLDGMAIWLDCSYSADVDFL